MMMRMIDNSVDDVDLKKTRELYDFKESIAKFNYSVSLIKTIFETQKEVECTPILITFTTPQAADFYVEKLMEVYSTIESEYHRFFIKELTNYEAYRVAFSITRKEHEESLIRHGKYV